ncbi:hypothetical protein [Ascidiaceihabitans sp.]|uniref:hypothetical protein n=1 Tax=Ascidiaceihabitans sp. TaxID=1872644 RepID=UPI00329872AB
MSDRFELFTPEKGTITRALGNTAMRFSIWPNEKNRLQLVNLIENFRDQVLNGTTTCILSHENLPGAMLGNSGVITLYPELETILGFLDEYLSPLQPEYLVYTRNMAAWKKSVYNQSVKSDGYTKTYEEFLDETADCGTWESLEERMKACLSKNRIQFFRLEDEVQQEYPGSQILEYAGMTYDEIEHLKPLAKQRNPKLNKGSLEFTRKLNNSSISRDARSEILKIITSGQDMFAK